MKVWLDNVRQAPPGWMRAFWPQEVISYLKTGEVDEVSLDHDLGNDRRGTGYDVLLWIEKHTANGWKPPVIRIHTANLVAHIRMRACVTSIKRLEKRHAVSR